LCGGHGTRKTLACYCLGAMQEKRERWMELAELAANEQDPVKLNDLVREIDRLLAEKQERLDRARRPFKPSE
jgi:hypothetical protein